MLVNNSKQSEGGKAAQVLVLHIVQNHLQQPEDSVRVDYLVLASEQLATLECIDPVSMVRVVNRVKLYYLQELLLHTGDVAVLKSMEHLDEVNFIPLLFQLDLLLLLFNLIFEILNVIHLLLVDES